MYHLASDGRASVTGATSSNPSRGRRWYSAHVASSMSPMLMLGRLRNSKVLMPISLPIRSSSMYRPIPSTIETTEIRNMTPMQTPSSVNALLSFWTRIVLSANRMASKNCMGEAPRAAWGLRGCTARAGESFAPPKRPRGARNPSASWRNCGMADWRVAPDRPD